VPNQPARDDWRDHESPARWTKGGTATASRQRPRTGGAGLEIDLAAPPRPGVMPGGLRASLPPRGPVNLPEAGAPVPGLEDLVSDPAFQATGAEWQRQQNRRCAQPGQPCETHRTATCPTVAVISLFPAQAQLLRLLVQRSTVLGASRLGVEVGVPSAFQHRECLAALISLTRSHTHLAVPFSAPPQGLVCALTRAAGRLMIFGDVGTLARRAQWHGALDHLDDVAGPHEQFLLGRLAGYARGQADRAASLEESGPV